MKRLGEFINDYGGLIIYILFMALLVVIGSWQRAEIEGSKK